VQLAKMSSLDTGLIRQSLTAEARTKLDQLEVFGSVASTNTYLMSQLAPGVGRFRVAIADHQSSGRGRHNRRWVSPPGAGLYMSFAYSFEEHPDHLPSLTLAIGVGVIAALQKLGIDGVSLKWPNDIVALDGKLGGILTELQSRATEGVTVVTGIGLNIDLPEDAETSIESDWARRVVDVSGICETVPGRAVIAAAIITELYSVMQKFAALGFVAFLEAWAKHDWLNQREVVVDLPDQQISGVAAGVDNDGALLVDTGKGKTRVVSGSIILAGLTE
jgi:BirA family biotin operon repressor/biotin-[acetyl-CoA-carboxylase] ligase